MPRAAAAAAGRRRCRCRRGGRARRRGAPRRSAGSRRRSAPRGPGPTPATAVLIPITRPRPSASAPPELPGLSAASVWITFSTRRPRAAVGSDRPSAETTPAVTDPVKPSGLPIATTSCPTRRSPASPSSAAGRSPSAVRITARSESGSEPTTSASKLAPVRERCPDAGAGAVDHVGRGQQVAVGGDHDAGAAALRATAPGAAFDPEVRHGGAEAIGHGRHGARVRVERLGVGQLARLSRRLRRRRATIEKSQSCHETEGSKHDPAARRAA